MAGQRLMVGFNGTELNDRLKFLIKNIKVGGVVLFSRNISSPNQLKELCLSIHDYTASIDEPPLFISIDQEGGKVARLKEPFTIFPGNSKMEKEEDALYFASVTSKELKECDINMDLAPVMDIAPKDIKSIMEGRAFGSDSEWVSLMGSIVIENLQKNKIMAVAKHFPGIGRTVADSHLDLPVLDADLESLESFDLKPFQSAINSDVAGIMLSHIIYKKIDPDFPASLSPKIARDLLRSQMKFNGIVMTDDLDMGAIEKHYDFKLSINQILISEIDIITICHESPKIDTAFEEVLKQLKDSPEMKKKGMESVERILKIKRKYLTN
ncbi:MAG: beta-N-acetylhexosaminidase [Desulfobacterales bacterium]|nr:beta-N-acetylhexosaminidase [Desulfobacterales bacterium]MBF0396069.1 beta-N-acetylhexosaminidase [Desulfobacterales bacterium]